MTNKQAAIKVIKRLSSNGFQALLAGGCVRDMLLRRKAGDYDVATSAQPDDVVKLFKRTIKVGAKFGVVIILLEDQKVEVATFRTETGYVDGRHPSVVKFASAAEDAGRRDFTINGMFYDPLKEKVIDYVDGRADLKKRLIRTIGKARERFSEDYLRMLRAVRFSTQLGFPIEQATWSAIRRNAKKITKISGERIAIELEAILTNPSRSVGTSMLVKSGLVKAIFPGFTGKHSEFAIDVLPQLPKKVDFALAIASLFAGCSTEFALEKCRILKLSRNQNKHIKFLLTNRGKLLEDRMPLSRLKLVLSEPYFWDLYELERAIQKALPDGKAGIAALNRLRKRIKDLGDVELRPKPLLSGHDLIRLGAIPGPPLGQLAEEMYIAQLEGKLQTSKQARQWAQDWLQKHRAIE
jgi:poly(A) polymerase